MGFITRGGATLAVSLNTMSGVEDASVDGCHSPQNYIVVVAGTDVPVDVTVGPYPRDTHVGIHTTDVQRQGIAIEVMYINGKVTIPKDPTNQWLMHVQPARDRHEQNVEAFRDAKGHLSLRFLRKVNKGEQLLVWYGDELARQNDIPILTPENIRGNQQYLCTLCKKVFKFPNSLKSHILFRCPRKSNGNETHSGFSVRSLLNLPRPEVPVSLPSVGTFLDREKLESIQNWLFMRSSAHKPEKINTEAASIRGLDRDALNLSVRDGTNMNSKAPSPSVSQPIQIFNHIHPPAFPIAIDQNAFRLFYPHANPMLDHQRFSNPIHAHSRLCCSSHPTQRFSQPNENCISQYNHNSLMAIQRSKFPGQPSCLRSPLSDTYSGESSQSGIPYSFPMPNETEGEPIDLIPRSLFTSKSRKGHLCIYCGKLYSRKYGLKIHLRTHTGYKPLKCKVCFRPFGDPSNLNKHVRLHAEGDTPYRCEFCGKVLVRRRDLERHIRSRHPDEAALSEKMPEVDVEEDEDEESDVETIVVDSTTDMDIVVT